MKYTCPKCGGLLTTPKKERLDRMIIVHNGSCSGTKPKPADDERSTS